MNLRHVLMTAAASVLFAAIATAQPVTLKIQTHYPAEHPSGKHLAEFANDLKVMSNGEISVEMFYASSVVASSKTFDAAIDGTLDCDATGGAFQTGRNPAFQFVGDLMGGYDTPWQQYSWLYYGDGLKAAQSLYNEHNMHFVGWTIYGQESLSSSRPIAGPKDLKGWKFRSPPGMQADIFKMLGADPVAMNFTEIFTALEKGVIEGADASGLANNVGLGIYEIVKHASYPGFHSMPSDHLACNLDVWNGLTEQQRRIIEVAWQKLAFQIALSGEKANAEAAANLPNQGVTLYTWSDEDRKEFRKAAQIVWEYWGDKSIQSRSILESHKAYLRQLGLIDGGADLSDADLNEASGVNQLQEKSGVEESAFEVKRRENRQAMQESLKPFCNSVRRMNAFQVTVLREELSKTIEELRNEIIKINQQGLQAGKDVSVITDNLSDTIAHLENQVSLTYSCS